MIQKDRDPQVEPFPTKLIGTAMLTTLAVLAWLSWFVYDEYQIVQDTNTRIVGLERVRGDIVHLDEVLTMSASMAAATGEIAWIERYRSFEPKLDTAIKQAIDIARRPDIADAIRETDAANIELVRMENQVFKLVRKRKLGEARAILSGKRYSDQKQVYANGMEKLLRGLRAEREAAVGSQRTSTLGSIWAMAAVAAVIIVVWLLILGRVREWRAAMSKNVSDLVRAEEAIRKSHDDLEQRVTDRTRELEDEIAERKRTEEALRESQQLLNTILHHMPTMVYLRDAEGRFKLVNHKYEEVHDVDNEKIRGRTVHEVFPKRSADEFANLDAEVLKHHRVQEGEERHWLGEEERTYAVVKFPIFDIAGDVVGVGGVDIDITDRKRTEKALAEKEAQLRVALDNMPGGMMLGDRDLNHVLFNSQYSELYELPDGLVRVGGSIRDELRFQADRGDYGPGDKDDLIERVVTTYQRGEAVSFERAIAGSGRTLQVYLAPTPEGGYATIVTDITERKRVEEELQAAYGIIKDQKERMESELNVGHEIQMSFVPDFSSLPDRTEFSICATLEPAREVGGDFYDSYFLDEERFCFCIGDVSGKGVPAALFMAMAKTLIKSRAGDDRSIASILTHVNDDLSVDNQACMFVTVFAGILNIRTGELVYTNAGHNPPYLRKKDGTLQSLDQRHGPAVGAKKGMVYKEERDTLEPGDLLFLYTDGVTEAMDSEHRLFSEDRLKDLLTAKSTKDVQTAVDHTVAAVRTFEGEAERTDDVTVLALEFHGRPEDALRVE